MSKPEEFAIPEVKDMIGWRPNSQDRKNLRILMADRRETSFSNLLRSLVAEAAEPTRRRWLATAKRIAAQEDARAQ